ncbi:MAG: sulfurtransferase TusA family protein [Magnetococcales bacterium]|nr:sulfurtransferase TusA family protein [Magnetococcales bacterium]
MADRVCPLVLSATDPQPDVVLDARRLLCPMPIMRAEATIREMPSGAVLAVWATDPGLAQDLPAWCASHGHQFLGIKEQGRERIGWVVKG